MNIAISTQRGDAIVHALNEYYDENGQFPISLTELVPMYIDDIPPPLAGNGRWEYSVNDTKQTFFLLFGLNKSMYPSRSFSSLSGMWLQDE